MFCGMMNIPLVASKVTKRTHKDVKKIKFIPLEIHSLIFEYICKCKYCLVVQNIISHISAVTQITSLLKSGPEGKLNTILLKVRSDFSMTPVICSSISPPKHEALLHVAMHKLYKNALRIT